MISDVEGGIVSATISGVFLNNFRSFSKPTKIDLRPITLLYGQNSAGKSSIIKSILLLQQSLAARRRWGDETSTFIYSGDSVDLGSFQASISGHVIDKKLSVGIEISNRDDQARLELPFETTWHTNEKDDNRIMTLTLSLSGEHLNFERHPRKSRWLLTTESVRAFLNITASEQDLLTQSVEMVENLRANCGYLPEFSGDRFPAKLHSRLVPPNTRRQWLSLTNADRSRDGESDDTRPVFGEAPLVHRWDEICSATWGHCRRQLNLVTHIGPLRQEPRRFERYSPTDGLGVGTTGQQMLSLLYERPNLVVKVNDYLDQMELPYRIKIRALGSGAAVGEVIYLALVDEKTGLELSPSDVGVGYSQVLPLITQSTLARNQLVCIEQPELHLHPAMQARLAELFISEALGGSQIRFLVETHSESLMLRILRRIREGLLRPEDVQVIYIDQDETGASLIHSIPIDRNGDFTVEWPKGFFDERLQEFGF
jgi:predicted ATPase